MKARCITTSTRVNVGLSFVKIEDPTIHCMHGTWSVNTWYVLALLFTMFLLHVMLRCTVNFYIFTCSLMYFVYNIDHQHPVPVVAHHGKHTVLMEKEERGLVSVGF